jgi:hypothetical protein
VSETEPLVDKLVEELTEVLVLGWIEILVEELALRLVGMLDMLTDSYTSHLLLYLVYYQSIAKRKYCKYTPSI